MHATHWLRVHTAIYVMFRLEMLSLRVYLLCIAMIPITLVRWLTKLNKSNEMVVAGIVAKGHIL